MMNVIFKKGEEEAEKKNGKIHSSMLFELNSIFLCSVRNNFELVGNFVLCVSSNPLEHITNDLTTCKYNSKLKAIAYPSTSPD